MTANSGSAGLAHVAVIGRPAARQASGVRRREHVIRFVALAAVARRIWDKRTLQATIVLAIGLIAVGRLGKEHGTPALDWYRARGRDENRRPA